MKLETPPKGKLTQAQYDEMIDDRPYKILEASRVGYRKGEGEERCENCFHFFVGKVAGRNVCEIFRPKNEDVNPDFVCDWWTEDGHRFPLRP